MTKVNSMVKALNGKQMPGLLGTLNRQLKRCNTLTTIFRKPVFSISVNTIYDQLFIATFL